MCKVFIAMSYAYNGPFGKLVLRQVMRVPVIYASMKLQIIWELIKLNDLEFEN